MEQCVPLLLMAPPLAVLGWLYWHFAPPASRRVDAWVLAIACVSAVFCSMLAFHLATGHGGAIWKHVAAAVAAYGGFNVVLLGRPCVTPTGAPTARLTFARADSVEQALPPATQATIADTFTHDPCDTARVATHAQGSSCSI